MKRILSILFTLGLLLNVANELANMGVPLLLSAMSAFAVYVVLLYAQANRKGYTGLTLYDIQMEVWSPHIVEELFKNNHFLMRAQNDSDYVSYKSVHKPQEAAGVDWTKNRVWGAAPSDATDRTDTILTYQIDEWTSDLMRVKNIDTLQLSYDKRQSVLRQMLRKGKETIADNMLYNWAASLSANILRTSGVQNNDQTAGIITSELSHVHGVATGARKVFGLFDMKRAFTFMANQNVGMDGWVMVMTPNMYQELLDDILISKYRNSTPELDVKTGIVDRLMNFDIYLRTTTTTYTNDGTPARKAVGAAGATTDNDSAVFWSESAVCSAIGNNKLMYNADQAAYGGDVMRGFIYMGGSKERSTEVGVGAIVQAAGE